MRPKDGGNLSDEQFERLKARAGGRLSRARRNAGRPLLLEGGLDWKAMALTPKDMDFIEAKNAAAREIALAFGVPPMLLGIPGDNTYANYQEANRAFWRADRAAAGRPHGARRWPPGWRRRSATACGSGPTPTRSRRWRPSARRCGRGVGAAEFPDATTRSARRWATGGGCERLAHRNEPAHATSSSRIDT